MKQTSKIALNETLNGSARRVGGMLRSAGATLAAVCMMQLLQADPVVIAHKSIPAETLLSLDVQQVFLGKRTNFPDGQTIQFAVLREGRTHEEFLTSRVRKQPSQFVQYWKTAVFSGRGKMPPEMSSEADMAKFVSETPGAVGYVSSAYADANNLSAICSVAR